MAWPCASTWSSQTEGARCCRAVLAVGGQPPVGAGADADVVLIGPQRRLCALVIRGGGVVAGLVPPTGRAQTLPGPVVEIGGFVVFLGADDALRASCSKIVLGSIVSW